MRYWKAAAYGGLASVLWVVLVGVFPWTLLFTGKNGMSLFAIAILVGAIVGIPLGAVGGVVLVKFKDQIPSSSTFMKAVAIALITWALSVGVGSVNVVQNWFAAFGDSCSLAGVLLWASLISNFIDSDTKKRQESTI